MPSELLAPPAAPVRLLLRPREAAEALAVSPRTLWHLSAPRGPIPVLRLPGRGAARSLRYDIRDLMSWIDRMRQEEQLETATAAGRVTA